ncbi:GDP-fucose protein O-fucosyltransferase [Tanacetum coccineum]
MKLQHCPLLVILLLVLITSVMSESSFPKPRHSRLFKSALQQQDLNDQQWDLWTPLPNQGWKPCIDSTSTSVPDSSGYIQVFLDGGLNQQRMGICDAVAVAKILNATLVIPYLEVNPVWKDTRFLHQLSHIFMLLNFMDMLIYISLHFQCVNFL